MASRRGDEDPSGGILSMCEGGRRGRGDEEDYDDGDEVNGDILQWHAAMRNGAVLTLEGYIC